MNPDPYVMYIVVRESLNLGAGKIGAQCGHAVDYLGRAAEEKWPTREEIDLRSRHMLRPEAWTEEDHAKLTAMEEQGQRRHEHLSDYREWRKGEHGKIVLGATDAEFEKVKAEEPDHFLVIDNGHTEVAPKTETCLGLWPRRRSTRSKTLKRLRLLPAISTFLFLEELRERARKYGWVNCDYGEIRGFVKACYEASGFPITDAELDSYDSKET